MCEKKVYVVHFFGNFGKSKMWVFGTFWMLPKSGSTEGAESSDLDLRFPDLENGIWKSGFGKNEYLES